MQSVLTDSAELHLTHPRFFSALREIARSLSAAWDLDTTLDLIARKTTEVMRADSCTIYLLDTDQTTLRLRATTGLARQALGRATLRVGEGMTGHAVAQNRPVYAANAQHDPHFKWVDDTGEIRFQSLLAVPLVLDERPIGALNIQTIATKIFTDDEIEILALIGDLAAGALVKAQLYDRQKRQLDELRTLAQVSEAVTSPQYLDEILQVVTEMAAQTIGADDCTIYLFGHQGDDFNADGIGPYIFGGSPNTPQPDQQRLEEIVRGGRPLHMNASHLWPAGSAPQGQTTEPVGNASLLAVPLTVQDRAIGVLTCLAPPTHQFTSGQETLLTTLANQTALAIENARLVTNTAVVREMHHRIKNNLQTVAMLMQLQLPDADKLETRHVLLTNIHRIRSIAAVHEILSEQGFRLVNVKTVLERVAHMTLLGTGRPEQAIDIAVHGDNLQLPSRAATALSVVVNELVQNSLEHAFVNRESGRIDISLARTPDALMVLVRDDGIGLPDDMARNLGLEIAETLVHDDLQGSLEFRQLPAGTEACIRLPRAAERPEGAGA